MPDACRAPHSRLTAEQRAAPYETVQSWLRPKYVQYGKTDVSLA